LIREATRQYLERIDHWDRLFSFGDELAHAPMTEDEVVDAIKAYRRERRTRTA
jgi:hypothetical protein